MTLPACEHAAFLAEALRSPSPHNAQPWRLVATANSSYELHYDHLQYLPHDPDDRDAYLTLGAFYETAALVARRHGLVCSFEPVFERTGSDLFAGVLRVDDTPSDLEPDPLSDAVLERVTNRRKYRRRPLPPELALELARNGCTFVEPRVIASVVRRASVLSWTDRQFVADLRRWTRFGDRNAPDGMTPHALALSRLETVALRFALLRTRLSRPVAHVYAHRDVTLTHASSTIAVLAADSMDPVDLFEAGRRLLRAWTTATAAGYSTHPISVVIDRPETRPELAAIAGVRLPVALFRVGYTRRRVPWSNRRLLHTVLGAGGRPGAQVPGLLPWR